MRQPWAFAIMAGLKDVENRSWSTTRRGPIAIHAGQALDGNFASSWPTELNLPPFEALVRGAIIGVVDLVDVVENSASPWAQEGLRHWVLANPRDLTTPIPFRGSLGLLELADDTVQKIQEQLREVTQP